MNVPIKMNKDFEKNTINNYIHPTAIIEVGAKIGNNVKIGAKVVVNKDSTKVALISENM